MASRTELLERIKAATGPNYQLECDIDKFFKRDRSVPLAYTFSIDAALALVDRELPGAFWLMAKGRLTASEPLYAAELMFGSDEILGEAEAHSAPLAILGALLSATPKTAQQGEEG